MSSSRSLRVAAIQMSSRPGHVAENLVRASRFVATSAERGAAIALFPEFAANGYRLTSEMWSQAEAGEGVTVAWLRAQATAHQIMVGTSYVEARGEDFYETFALADERGQIVIRVRKSMPAAVESFFIRGADDPRVFETAHGRIGVLFGYESLHASAMHALAAAEPDLVLMPHCAPTPNVSRGFRARDAAQFEESLRELTHTVATELGVPVLMANPSGPWKTPMPLFPAADSRFSGCSTIVDGDGAMCAQADDGEGVVVADVTLDASRRRRKRAQPTGRWARTVPWFVNGWAVTEQLGRAAYLLSRTRRREAREISHGR